MKKKFVRVLTDIDEVGKMTPKSVVFDDITYTIDRVLDVRNCASFKVGGIGLRFRVRIGNNETNIFFEDGRWFVEEKE